MALPDLDEDFAMKIVIRLAKLGWNELIMDTRATKMDLQRAQDAIRLIAGKYNVKVDFN